MFILEAIYVLGAAAFLNIPQGLHRLLVSDPSLVHHHRFAWSWVPGYVEVWGLQFGVQDSTMELYFTAEKASLWINLAALRRKEFHATHPTLSGLEFFFRGKRTAKELGVAMVRARPVLPAFPTLPPNGPTKAPADRWKVRLDGLKAPGAHVWFDRYRFRGALSVAGGLFLHTGGHGLEVPPSQIQFENGALTVGDKKLVEDWDARINARLSLVGPGRLKDLEMFRALDATIDTEAQIHGFAMLNYLMQDLPQIRFSEGESRITARVKIQAGKADPTSRVSFRTARVVMRLWDATLAGGIEMDSFYKKGVATLKAKIGAFGLRFASDGPVAIKGNNLQLTFHTPHIDLARPLRPISVHLQMPTARLVNLETLNPLLPRGGVVKFVGGEAEVSAEFTASSAPTQVDFGRLKVHARKGMLSVRDRVVKGSLRLDAPFAKGKFSKGHFDVSGTKLELRGFALDSEPAWWMSVGLNRAQWKLDKTVSGEADVEVSARDLHPLMNIFLSAKNASLPGFIKNLLSFENLRAKTHFAADDESLAITDFHASSDSTHLWGWLKETPLARDGRLLMQIGPFAAGLEIQDKRVALKLNDAFSWYGEPITVIH